MTGSSSPDEAPLPGLGLAVALETIAGTAKPASAGSAAALAGALAAAVTTKVARATGSEGESAQAIALSGRLTRLAENDAEALGSARRALAAAGPGGDGRRDFELGRLLVNAAAVPADVADACADVAVLAAELAARGDEWSPDARAAAWLATAAARGAAHLVEINLAAGPDDPHARRANEALRLAVAATAAL